MVTENQSASLEAATLEHASAISQPAGIGQIERWRPLLFAALDVCLLLWVAIYNGYPTVFSDTGGYLLTGAFFIPYTPFRAPGYSVFARVTSHSVSPWFTIVAQAVIVAYVLRETCNYLVGGNRKFRDYCLLAAICILAALTSLPWVVSQLMPDVFAGVLFLSAFLLAFAAELRVIQKIVLAVIFTISVSAHTSLFPIAVLLVVALAVLKFFGRQPHDFSTVRPVLAWLLAPIIAAGILTASLNSKMGLGFKVTPSRNIFLLARLFGDGLAQDYLRANCPRRPYISCRYLSNLPRNQDNFLFYSPLLKDLTGHDDEMADIVRGTLAAYPIKFVAISARNSAVQLAILRTGDEVRANHGRYHDDAAIPQVFPQDFQSFKNARQYRGDLVPLVRYVVAPLDMAIFWVSVAGCIWFARTRRFARINQFFYAAVALLVINASVCATLAGIFDRYQSRVAWIIPFCLTAYICCWVWESKHDTAYK
jgi:hypothetical protein